MRFILPVILILFFSCSKSEDLSKAEQEQFEQDLLLIEEYLAGRGLTANKTSSGLHYIIEEPGDGDHPGLSNTVTVNYRGYLTNNIIFDETKGHPATFPLSGVIKGWQEGIPLFKKNGKGMLLIPSRLGYGSSPPQGSQIPINAVLIFEVHLINFQ